MPGEVVDRVAVGAVGDAQGRGDWWRLAGDLG
jgi:hypothetical protein